MSTLNALYSVSPRDMFSTLEHLLRCNLVPFVKSSPGRGKSAIIRSLADHLNLKLIDIRLSMYEPQDFTGLPFRDGEWSRFLPFADFMPIEGTDLPVLLDEDGNIIREYDGWLVLLDEFTHAEPEMMRASYKLILDRMVGSRNLHSNVKVILAGNSVSDNALANNPGTALNSRVTHITLASDAKFWYQDVAPMLNIDYRIIGYIANNELRLNDFDPDQDEHAFCSERTWEFVSNIIQGQKDVSKFSAMIAGTITPGISAEFVKFCEIYDTLNSLEDIIKDPENISIPTKSQILWATVTWLTREANAKNIDALSAYVNRMDIQFAIIFVRLISPELISGSVPNLLKLIARVGKATGK